MRVFLVSTPDGLLGQVTTPQIIARNCDGSVVVVLDFVSLVGFEDNRQCLAITRYHGKGRLDNSSGRRSGVSCNAHDDVAEI